MTGQHYKSHTSIWITNRIQELHAYLSDILQNTLQITGWVNGNLFLPTLINLDDKESILSVR